MGRTTTARTQQNLHPYALRKAGVAFTSKFRKNETIGLTLSRGAYTLALRKQPFLGALREHGLTDTLADPALRARRVSSPLNVLSKERRVGVLGIRAAILPERPEADRKDFRSKNS